MPKYEIALDHLQEHPVSLKLGLILCKNKTVLYFWKTDWLYQQRVDMISRDTYYDQVKAVIGKTWLVEG